MTGLLSSFSAVSEALSSFQSTPRCQGNFTVLGYTSKASFLDLDPIPTYGKEESEPVFSGRRVKRGMYKASDKRKINADVNGSYNIMRKASPNAFRSNGVEDGNGVLASLVVHPVRIVIPLRTLVCGTRVH
ncbi:MAG TPA: hypothetical protein VN207_10685 [Ktedonobacteraceae bacterium]|nr:hypothetical protein [Ktedonobacteraceae bacterium]